VIQDLLCWTWQSSFIPSLPQEGLGGERVEALSLDLDDEAAAEGGAVGFTTATADAVSLSSYKVYQVYQVHQVTKWHCR
jgi:hypothetical protein